jgi:hypothetical protein
MVVESSSARLELHDPFIGVHLEYSATIFTVVHHSVTLLRSIEQEHNGKPVGTMLTVMLPKSPSSTLQVDPALQCIFYGLFSFLTFVSFAGLET